MSKKSTRKAEKPDERHALFARIPAPSFLKLQSMAADRTKKSGKRVTMQDVVVDLIHAARA